MKLNLKRFLAYLLTALMLVSVVPASAIAEITAASNTSASIRSIMPDQGVYVTFEFYAGEELVDTQIVKNGAGNVTEPKTPITEPGQKFVGWYVGNTSFIFGRVEGYTHSQTVRVEARYSDVYYVFFKDNNGRIVETKEGKTNDSIQTGDVTFPVKANESITGWYTEEDFTNKVESVTLEDKNVTLYAKVEEGYWITYDSEGGSYIQPAFYAKGTTAAAPTAPSRPGYTFDGWFTNEELTAAADFSSIKTNTTVHAKWTAASTTYTVIHFWENADDDGYSFKESETKRGTTGAQTAATATSYPGFTAQTITQQKIAGDGSTIVSVYYKRNVYQVKFYNRSGSKEDTSLRIEAKYGANIKNQWPDGSWYVSTGGSTAQAGLEMMPLNGKSFYGKVKDGKKPAYYYVEALPGEGEVNYGGKSYKLDHTDYWPSGWTVTKEDRYAITGFTFNSGTRIGGNLDGAKFYYDRNSYNVVYMNNGAEVNKASYKYQADISDAGNYKPTTPPAGMEGYVFVGWYDNELGEGSEYVFNGKTMPAQNITVYAKWVAPVHTVTVYDHKGVELDKFEKVEHGSTIDEGDMPKAELEAKLAAGEVFLGWVLADGTPFNFNTEIKEDYEIYAKVGNTSKFTVIYDANDSNAEGTVKDDNTYANGALADVKPNGFTNGDKMFLYWNTRADGKGDKYYPNGSIKVTKNEILYAIWATPGTKVTLTYHSNFGTDVTKTTEPTLVNGQVTILSYSETTLPTRAGYTFTGWDTDLNGTGTRFAERSKARLDADGNNDLYAQWTANTDTKYTVEFYYQNDDGKTYPATPNTTDTRTGTTDATASVTDVDKADKENGKYTLDENQGNVFSGTILGDGSLVLKLYFKLNTAEYTIHHYLKGTEVKVANDETGTMTIGHTLTADKSDALYADYKEARVDSYDPSPSIEIKAGENVITVYYTVPLTITADSDEKVYDGTELKKGTFTVEGLVNGDAANKFTLSMTAGSTITDVGSKLNVIDRSTVKYDGRAIPSYYTVTYVDGTLTITASEAEVVVTIVGKTDTVTYDGTEKKVEGYTVTIDNDLYTEDDFEFSGEATAKGTDANTYPMGLKVGDFENKSSNFSKVTFVVTDGWLKIDQKPLTITAGSDEKVYDGEPLTKNSYTSSELAAGDSFESVKVTGSITEVGSVDNVASDAVIKRGEKNVTGNYAITYEKGTLKVTPVTTEVVVTIVGDKKTFTYDGTEKTAEGYTVTTNNSLYTEKDFTFNGTKVVTAKDASATSYPMGLKVGDFENKSSNFTNVKFVVTDGSLTINPIAIELTAKSAEKEYDGTPLTDDGYEITSGKFVDGEGLESVTVEGSQTLVGFSENKITGHALKTGTKSQNYTITYKPGTLTVKNRTTQYEIMVEANSGEKVYDGKELKVEGFKTLTFTVNGLQYKVEGLTASKIGTNVSDSGVVEVKGTPIVKDANNNDVTAQFKVTTVNGLLTIKARPITITAKDNTVQYDGKAHGGNGYEVAAATETTGLANGHTVDGVTIIGSKIEVGKYVDLLEPTTATIVDANDKAVTANYAIEYVPGTLTIETNKTELKVIANSNSWTYDGKEHSDGGYTVEFGTEKHTVEAGKSATLSTGDKVTATITKKVKNVSDTEEGNNVIVTLVVENEDQYEKITKVSGTLTITPVTDEVVVTIVGNTDTVTYDGTEQSVTGYTVTSISDDLYTANDFTFSGDATAKGTDANTYPMGLSEKQFKNISENFTNVRFDVTDGWLTINPFAITITATSYTVEYDGRAHGGNGYTATPTVNGQSISEVPISGEATDAGTYTNLLEPHDAKIVDAKGNDVTKNYEITYVKGTLTITKRGAGDDKVKVIANSDTVTYDGQAHGENGYTTERLVEGHKVSTVTIDGSKTDVGTYTDLLVPHDATIVDAQDNDVTKNYEITYVAGTLKIEPKKVTITAEDATKVYDGKALTQSEFTATALEEGDTHEFKVAMTADSKITNVGTQPNVIATVDGEDVTTGVEKQIGNYLVTTANGTLEVTPVTDEVVVKIVGKTKTETYDGTEKKVEGYTVTIDNDLYTEGDFEFSGTAYAEGTNADTYPLGLKAEHFKNVSANFTNVRFDVTDGWLKIDPRKVTLTSGDGEKVYDGTALTNSEVTVSGDGFADGEGAIYDVTGSQLNVGESENKFTYALKDDMVSTNYEITTEFGTLKVTPVTDEVVVTITGREDSAQYDGAKHSVSGYDVVISNALYTEDCFEFGGKAVAEGVHAGEYAMGLNEKQFKNVSANFTNVKFVIERDGRLTIEQRALIITAGSYEGDYDGEWHGVGYTAEGLAETDKITALTMKDDAILYPGELTASFLPETLKITHADGTDSTGDYRVEYMPGKLVVNTVIVKYRVQYYYDGVLYGGATEEGTGEVLTKITEYRDKPRDMMFDHVDNFPLTLGLNEEENVIRVYYVHIPLTGYLGAHNVGDCIE